MVIVVDNLGCVKSDGRCSEFLRLQKKSIEQKKSLMIQRLRKKFQKSSWTAVGFFVQKRNRYLTTAMAST